MKPKYRIILSMLIFGSMGVFVRNIRLASAETALYRAVLGCVFILAANFAAKRRPDIKAIKENLIPLLVSGTALGFNWILLFEAYKYTTVSKATLSYYFAPVFVLLASCFIFKEPITKKKVLCFLVASAGLVLTVGAGAFSGFESGELTGIGLGLSAALLYAALITISRFYKSMASFDIVSVQFGVAILALLPYVLLTEGINVLSLDAGSAVCLIILGFVHTGFAYVLYFSAIKYVSGQEIAILSYVDPAFAVFISVAVLKESTGFLQIIGGIMILGATLVNELKAEKQS